jgi:hypothetical protein
LRHGSRHRSPARSAACASRPVHAVTPALSLTGTVTVVPLLTDAKLGEGERLPERDEVSV